MSSPPSMPPPAWYPDPADPALQRYWDGVRWSAATLPAPPATPASGQPAATPAPEQPAATTGYSQPAPTAGYGQPAPAPGYWPPGTPAYGPPGAPAYGPPAPAMFGNYVLADWGRRAGAALIDIAIGAVVVVALIVLGSAANAGTAGLLVGYAAVYLLYLPLTMMRKGDANGQTVGKQALGIRVVREAGGPFTYGSAVLREFVVRFLLFGVAGSLALGLVGLLDVLWPLWDSGKQALHDKVASTRVVLV